MEKYGFVYIWRDRKHKRFYIGCHWGTEDDGYICSSRWMRNALIRRPQDFKRRVIERTSSRKDTFVAEGKWLSQIKNHELGKKYYNKTNIVINHWAMDEKTYKDVCAKLGVGRRGKGPTTTSFKPGERRGITTEFKKGSTAHNKGKTLEEQYGVEKAIEIRQKQSVAKKNFKGNITTWQKGRSTWNKGLPYTWITDGISSRRSYNGLIPAGWYKGRPKNKRSFI